MGGIATYFCDIKIPSSVIYRVILSLQLVSIGVKEEDFEFASYGINQFSIQGA